VIADKVAIKEFAEAQWRARYKTQCLKPGSMAYKRAECEFFVGVMVGLQAVAPNGNNLTDLAPPIWTINLISGQPVVDLPKT
jgi:hypothetical protein